MNVLTVYINALKSLKFFLSDIEILKFLFPPIIVALFYGILFLFLSIILLPLGLLTFIPYVGDFIHTFHEWILSISSHLLFYVKSFTIITLLSPFNNLLSAKCDEKLNKKTFPYSVGEFFSDLWRAMKINSLLLLTYFISIILVYLVFAFLNVDFIKESIIFIITSFLYGFSFFDYNFERYKMPIFQTIENGMKNWQLILLGGVIFQILYIIPFIGVIIGPFLITVITTHVFLQNKSSWKKSN